MEIAIALFFLIPVIGIYLILPRDVRMVYSGMFALTSCFIVGSLAVDYIQYNKSIVERNRIEEIQESSSEPVEEIELNKDYGNG